jgi:hypothetical protein
MEIYETLHPETKRGAAGGGRAGKGTRTKTRSEETSEPVPSFADATAAALGVSPRNVAYDLQVGRLDEETKEAVKGTPIEKNREELLALARADSGERMAAVDAVKSGAATSVREALGQKSPAPKRDNGSPRRATGEQVTARDSRIRELLDGGMSTTEAAKTVGCSTSEISHAKKRLGIDWSKENPLRRLFAHAQEFDDALSDHIAVGKSSWARATPEQIKETVTALESLRVTTRKVIQRLNKEAKEKTSNGEAHQVTS